MSDDIRKRASGFQRSTIANALRLAFDDGQLDFAEYTERSNTALGATYRDELKPLVADLDLGPHLPAPDADNFLEQVSARFPQPIMPDEVDKIHSAPPEGQQAASNALAVPTPNAVANIPTQARWLVPTNSAGQALVKTSAFLSETDRYGTWTCGPTHSVTGVCSELVLDFTNVILTSPQVELKITLVMAALKLIVPDQFQIQNNITDILAETTTDYSSVATNTGSGQANPTPPVTLILTGTNALSEIEIKVVHV